MQCAFQCNYYYYDYDDDDDYYYYCIIIIIIVVVVGVVVVIIIIIVSTALKTYTLSLLQQGSYKLQEVLKARNTSLLVRPGAKRT